MAKPFRVHLATTIEAEDVDDAKNIALVLLAVAANQSANSETGLREFLIAGTPVDLVRRRREVRDRKKYRRGVAQPDELKQWAQIISHATEEPL